MCINKGLKIPEDILADKNFEPAVKPVAKSVNAGTQAMLSEQEVKGLVGNFIENGKLGYQKVELIAELVVEQGDSLARLPLHASLMPAGDIVNQVIGLDQLVVSAPKLSQDKAQGLLEYLKVLLASATGLVGSSRDLAV